MIEPSQRGCPRAGIIWATHHLQSERRGDGVQGYAQRAGELTTDACLSYRSGSAVPDHRATSGATASVPIRSTVASARTWSNPTGYGEADRARAHQT